MTNEREKANATVAARDVNELIEGLRERLEWQRDHGITPALKPGIYTIKIQRVADHPDEKTPPVAT